MSDTKLCKKGLHHYPASARRCPACVREYKQREEEKAKARAYAKRPEVLARMREKYNTPEGKLKEKLRKQAPAVRARARARYQKQEVKAKVLDYCRARYAENPEIKAKVIARTRAYRATPHGKARKTELERERKKRPDVKKQREIRAREYRQSERGRASKKLSGQKRRARLKDSCSPGVAIAQWQALCDEYAINGELCCAYCQKACDPTVEHLLPLEHGGRDEIENVLPACLSCNSSKGPRLIWEWYRAKELFTEAELRVLSEMTYERMRHSAAAKKNAA